MKRETFKKLVMGYSSTIVADYSSTLADYLYDKIVEDASLRREFAEIEEQYNKRSTDLQSKCPHLEILPYRGIGECEDGFTCDLCGAINLQDGGAKIG